MKAELQKEHQWLQKLVGKWSCESEMCPQPEAKAETFRWTEQVRSLEGMWVLAEASGSVPDEGSISTLMLLGFDPNKGRFVGSFAGSMMPYLWVYEGDLDEACQKLTLNTEGPSFKDPNRITPYKDNIQFTSENERVLFSEMLDENGQWVEVMRVHYRRTE